MGYVIKLGTPCPELGGRAYDAQIANGKVVVKAGKGDRVVFPANDLPAVIRLLQRLAG